jgi:ABC-type dipeptide/oligopeptide/nickel transport system permease component
MTRNSEIWRFIFRRLLGTLPLLIGVGVFTFILVRVLPGDPAAYYAKSRMVLGETELARQALARSIEAFNDDTEQRDRIIAAAQQLGLNQ